MQNKNKYLLIFFLVFSAAGLYAQRGKISGRVIDDVTKEPLTGANVIIEGTQFGSVVDIKGVYNIISVPPGKYTIAASMVGYGKVVYKDVEVNIDRTTEINFRLKDKSVQLGTVEIVAQKPKVIKDQTSSASTISDEQLRNAPIEGLRGAMELSTSFQKNAKGEYQVRGSNTNEVNFQINGVEQGNSNNAIPAWGGGATKANNSWKYDVNPIGVQQLQMISGGFSAEYGNAQAGVVKVVMKEGAPVFNGEFRVEYRPAGQYHWGPYIYDKSNFEWKTWGNLNHWLSQIEASRKSPGNNIFTQLGMNKRYAELYDKVYGKNGAPPTATTSEIARWDSLAAYECNWAYQRWIALHTPDENNPLGVYDYRNHNYMRYMIGFGGPIGKNPDLLKFFFSGEYKKNPTRLPTPEKDQIYQNYFLTLSSQAIKDNRFKLMLGFQKYTGGLFSGSDDIRWSGLPNIESSYKYFVTRDPVRTEQTSTASFNWVYTISNKSFLETTVAYQYEKYELPYRYLLTWYDEADRIDGSNDSTGILLNRGDWWDQTYFTSYENIATDFFQDNRSSQFSFSSDYTNQIIPTNLFKLGFKLSYWDLSNTAVTYNFKANSFVTQQGVAEHYKAYPINAALYLQDKMEYEGMVANIGLRGEAYNYQSNAPKDIFNAFYMGTQGPGKLGALETEPTKTKFVLLPRVGLSFPIGENTAFRLQYGHFASMPTFSQALSTATFYGWTARGNPNLEPKKTINYEFGIQQLLDEDTRLDIAIYYNDRVTQIGNLNVASYTGDARANAGFTNDNTSLFFYDSFANNLFGSTIGMEINLESVTANNLTYRLSYSLSQTTDGVYGSTELYPDNASGYQKRVNSVEHISPWDRTHSFRGLVQYAFKKDEGPEIFGIKIFEESSAGLTYSINSGLPYRYITEFDQVKDVAYNRRYPLESSFDFNFIKNINFGSVRIILGLRIMNLFDNQWLTQMESNQESADKEKWVRYGITIDQPDQPNKKSFLLYPYRAYSNLPRQVFFTMGVGI